MRTLFFAAVMMFLATLLGALGAHALHPQLVETGQESAWRTAFNYHVMHGLALLAISILQLVHREAGASRALKWCGRLWLTGIGGFSGSLYILALGGPRWLGPVTPLGGLLLLAGWLLLAIGAWRLGRTSAAGP